MNSATLDLINEKLKNEPQEILDRVLGYLEGILEDKDLQYNDFELTDEMKKQLKEIAERPLSEHVSEEEVKYRIRQKYGF
ncbi:MAG: hypothetical protein K0M56_08240 [Kaistella sp.]|nr:hypothetical protein [Kaistella sp.]